MWNTMKYLRTVFGSVSFNVARPIISSCCANWYHCGGIPCSCFLQIGGGCRWFPMHCNLTINFYSCTNIYSLDSFNAIPNSSDRFHRIFFSNSWRSLTFPLNLQPQSCKEAPKSHQKTRREGAKTKVAVLKVCRLHQSSPIIRHFNGQLIVEVCSEVLGPSWCHQLEETVGESFGGSTMEACQVASLGPGSQAQRWGSAGSKHFFLVEIQLPWFGSIRSKVGSS